MSDSRMGAVTPLPPLDAPMQPVPNHSAILGDGLSEAVFRRDVRLGVQVKVALHGEHPPV